MTLAVISYPASINAASADLKQCYRKGVVSRDHGPGIIGLLARVMFGYLLQPEANRLCRHVNCGRLSVQDKTRPGEGIQ